MNSPRVSRRSARFAAGSVAATLALIAATASAQHVIEPGQEPLVLAMLGGDDPLPGGCRFDGASIEPTLIRARYACSSGNVTLLLKHLDGAPSDAIRTRMFALVAPDEPAAKAIAPLVADRVRRREDPWRWRVPAQNAPPPPPPDDRPIPPPPKAASPYRFAAGVALAPIVLGAALGLLVGRLRRWPPLKVALIAGALLHLGVIALAPRLSVSIYDALHAALVGSIALTIAAAPPDGRKRLAVASAALSLVVGGAAGELVLRGRPIVRDRFGEPSKARLAFAPEEREWPALALFPEAFDRDWFQALRRADLFARRPGKRRVLHIGDSMVAGGDVPDADRFQAVLERLRPDEEHVNLGISNTGLDVYLVILKRWMARLAPDEVVVHAFATNDLDELDRPYASCGGEALLVYEGEGARVRCGDRPEWRFSARKLLAIDPAPYPVRVFSGVSELAGAGLVMHDRLRHGLMAEASTAAPREHARAVFVSIRDEAARARVPFTIAMMPLRGEIEGTHSMSKRREERETILAAARSAGLRAVDSGPALAEAHERDPGTPLFQAVPTNPHMSSAGHRAYAAWLAKDVLPRGP